jgi:hypothetical protein
LTDGSVELRSSLKDLLFKDGSFRWNRLENLLRNAKDSPDYNFDLVLEQAGDFLFSERGAFIRERLVNELINTIDLVGRRTWFNLTSNVREQVGLAVQETPTELLDNTQSLQHLKNIWGILQDTQGFDPMRLVPLLAKLVTKPETHLMGQQVMEGLVQKAIARFIRNWVLELEGAEKR